VNRTGHGLTVSVPVEIDGKVIDAVGAPIFIDINVGGYTSSAVSNSASGRSRRGFGAGQRGSGRAGHHGGGGCQLVDNGDLTLAAGYVVVNPGCRGRGSAGGGLSTLLAASGGSSMYDSYLTELGAGSVSDTVFASASYSPITDLDHGDMAYEWMWGDLRDAHLGQLLRLPDEHLPGAVGPRGRGRGRSGRLSEDLVQDAAEWLRLG